MEGLCREFGGDPAHGAARMAEVARLPGRLP